MSSTDSDTFILYLSQSDKPVAFAGQSDDSHINDAFITKILKSDDVVEQAVNEGLASVIPKRLCTNPFLEEDLRCKLFEKHILSYQSDDILSEICRETYLTNNLQSNYRNIATKTSAILNWKPVKNESLKRIRESFIHSIKDNCDQATLNEINNKIINR